MQIVEKIISRVFVVAFFMAGLCLTLGPLMGSENAQIERAYKAVDVIDGQEAVAVSSAVDEYEERASVVNKNKDSASFVDMSRFRKALKKIAQIGSDSLNKKNDIVIDHIDHGDESYDNVQEVSNEEDGLTIAVEPEIVAAPVVVNTELKNMRTGLASEFKKIKYESTDPLLDKKIDAVVKKFDLKLSQTQNRIDVIAKRVDDVEKQQKQVLNQANKLKKSYVKERVRREIADEVIKQQLTTD